MIFFLGGGGVSMCILRRITHKINLWTIRRSLHIDKNQNIKVTTHSNNRNSKSSREIILGSVRLWQSVILRNYDMFSTDSNARYTARW